MDKIIDIKVLTNDQVFPTVVYLSQRGHVFMSGKFYYDKIQEGDYIEKQNTYKWVKTINPVHIKFQNDGSILPKIVETATLGNSSGRYVLRSYDNNIFAWGSTFITNDASMPIESPKKIILPFQPTSLVNITSTKTNSALIIFVTLNKIYLTNKGNLFINNDGYFVSGASHNQIEFIEIEINNITKVVMFEDFLIVLADGKVYSIFYGYEHNSIYLKVKPFGMLDGTNTNTQMQDIKNIFLSYYEGDRSIIYFIKNNNKLFASLIRSEKTTSGKVLNNNEQPIFVMNDIVEVSKIMYYTIIKTTTKKYYKNYFISPYGGYSKFTEFDMFMPDKEIITSYFGGTQFSTFVTTESNKIYKTFVESGTPYSNPTEVVIPYPPVESGNNEGLVQYCDPSSDSRPDVDSPIQHISSHHYDSLILKKSGKIFHNGNLINFQSNYFDIGKIVSISANIDNSDSGNSFNNYKYIFKDEQNNVYGRKSLNGLTYELNISNVTEITSGPFTRLYILLKSNNDVYGIGYNGYGMLSNITTNNGFVSEPTKMPISNVKQVACGKNHSLFLKTNGKVFGCGYRNKLGFEMINSQDIEDSIIYEPTKISLSNIKQIACTDSASIFLNTSGEVYILGQYSYGEYGIEKYNPNKKNTNSLNAIGQHWSPYKIPNLPIISYINAGLTHIILMNDIGEVFASGNNQFGELGIENSKTQRYFAQVWIDDIIEVYCGIYQTFFVNKYGELFGCGNNENGQLGLPTTQKQYWVPTRIPI
jgi:hypothetical protein